MGVGFEATPSTREMNGDRRPGAHAPRAHARSVKLALSLGVLLPQLLGCGGRLSANPGVDATSDDATSDDATSDDATSDDATAESLPPVTLATCATTPPELPLAELPLATFPGQVQPIKGMIANTQGRWTVLGSYMEQVFIRWYAGGRGGSAWGYEVMSAGEPAMEPGVRARISSGPLSLLARGSDLLLPPDGYYSAGSWGTALPLTDGHEFSEVTGTSIHDFWLKAAPHFATSSYQTRSEIYRVVDGVATAVPPPALPRPDAKPGVIDRLQAGAGEELWAIQADQPGQFPNEVLHLTDGTWNRTGLVDVEAIFVASDHSVWAVGGTSIHRFADGCWVSWEDPRTMLGEAPSNLRRVWARSANEVWVTGEDQLLRHWNGEAWSLATMSTSATVPLGDLSGTPTGVWVLLRGYDPLVDQQVFFVTIPAPT
jgi:hypothetical protein